MHRASIDYRLRKTINVFEQPFINMKCITAIIALALIAVAAADTKPLEVESLEPLKGESVVPEAEKVARDKRGLLVGAAYTAPLAYSAYTAPVAYTSAAYASYPYAYAAYSSYPYYAAAYSAPYYLA